MEGDRSPIAAQFWLDPPLRDLQRCEEGARASRRAGGRALGGGVQLGPWADGPRGWLARRRPTPRRAPPACREVRGAARANCPGLSYGRARRAGRAKGRRPRARPEGAAEPATTRGWRPIVVFGGEPRRHRAADRGPPTH
eukprot:scaffold2084_cov365-Prasinococcus_capsulatus_cf.AAC.7